MKWLSPILILSIACAVQWSNTDMSSKMKNLPRLPDARLLVGWTPATLAVTSSDKTWEVAEGTQYLRIYPSLSIDGTLVAITRVKARYPLYAPPPMSLATYSLAEGKWTEYATEYEHVQDFQGSIAISPDNSKLAFAVADPRYDPRVQLHVIDLRSGAEQRYPVNGRHRGIIVSWSPDGRRVAYDTYPMMPYEGAKARDYRPEIHILDLETGKSTKIANGNMPAWSPLGEWIAYLDLPDSEYAKRAKNWQATPPPPTRLRLVRANGTGSRVLLSGRDLVPPLVWSPDSKMILLNESRDITGRVNICTLDLSTLKLTTRFENTPPVYGWAEAK